jgi:dipeptidyl aminopeptidase/acylaminoacyl peptidase
VIAAYGTWISPISADAVAAGATRLGAVSLDGGDVYWIEGRPHEGGRNVLVRRTADGSIADATPAGTNVRTRVHEYGGGAHVVSRGVVYYSEFADQRVYRLEPGGRPEPLTPPGGWFYADYAIDPLRPRLVCVREDHTAEGREAITTLVSLALDGAAGEGRIIASGHDFYSTPRFSPDGARLCWLSWDHPRMPWDGTELWVADVASGGALGAPRRVAGGERESIFQPGWSPDGTLYFVSDRAGWWNLYRLRRGRVEAVLAMEAEFGRPQWLFGMSTWAFAGPSRLIAAFQRAGRWRLASLDIERGAFTPLAEGLEPGESLAADGRHAWFVAGSATAPDALVSLDTDRGTVEIVRRASDLRVDDGYLSAPEAVEFPTEGGLTAHAFFYAPRHRDAAAPPGERPPLIVVSHGGPTASTSARLNLDVQFWTSRGFAVVDVNYGGSSGYGREYRRRLDGLWGIVDVADCVRAAEHLSAQGRADAGRLIIRGRSAGGYTTLAALAFRPGVFAAGASHFGVSDLEALAADTHKFESRYLDTLIGPYPEARATYRARSPIHAASRIRCPVIFFQGLEDRVVPPSQSKLIADALRANGVPVALVTFEGEQHGFRKRESVVRCLEAELAFYGAVLGFAPAGPLPPVEIDNLTFRPV